MSFTCAISGTVPQHPVLSPKSGNIFERALIEKHLKDNDTDPINGEPLTADELIDVNTTSEIVQPRAPNATSIPALLKMLQDEWDAEVLASYELKKYVNTLRQELTHSLYQNDAACRLIARLTKERDQAREALGSLEGATVQQSQQQAQQAPENGSTDAAEGPLADAMISSIKAGAKKLAKQRKKRFKAADFPSADNILNYTCQKTHSGLHNSRQMNILALATNPQLPNLILTGGSDKSAILFDRESEEVMTKYKEHKKKVSGVALHPTQDLALSSSHDSTVHIWTTAGDTRHTITSHETSVTGIGVHASGDYLLSFDASGKWGFSDIYTGDTLSVVQDDTAQDGGVTCGGWHPDGKLFALGTTAGKGTRVWDILSHSCVQTFEGQDGAITAMAFSENGFFFATAAEDASVKIWDLRNLQNLHTISLDAGYKANALAFDNTGRFLAVGGNDLRILNAESWEVVKTFSDHSKQINALQWSADTKTLLSAGADNAINVYE